MFLLRKEYFLTYICLWFSNKYGAPYPTYRYMNNSVGTRYNFKTILI
jgi:hypothetical protein